MTEAKTRNVGPANAMPAPTWHFLKANDTVIPVPEGLAASPDVTLHTSGSARGAAGAFEAALADEQRNWERTHPAPTAAERAERASFMAAEAKASYGGTAQSSYQRAADALEESRSLSAAFAQGAGAEVAAFLEGAAGKRAVVSAAAGAHVDAQVLVTAVPGAVSAAAIDIVAGAGATVNLSLTVAGGKTAHPALPASDPGKPVPPYPAGITGTTLRVFAGPGSDVNIARMQALDGNFDDIDDMGLFTADSARIHVRQTVLGASRSFTGLAGDLRGDGSRVQVDTHYLGNGSRELDFNYAMRQHGCDTECAMQANGVLAGRSKKVLRGAIDLVRGCKGSAGQENESVLLVDDGVRNVTVPVILCNEDDASGNHGATIGHLRSEQLFYLGCRDLSPEAAEHLFAEALLEQAALDAADGTAREAVVQLGEKLHPGFRARFDEEA